MATLQTLPGPKRRTIQSHYKRSPGQNVVQFNPITNPHLVGSPFMATLPNAAQFNPVHRINSPVVLCFFRL